MRHYRNVVTALLMMLQVTVATSGQAQFITPLREKLVGGSVFQIGGIGSISATDLDKLSNSASAQATLVVRPAQWAELYGSFNRGAGLARVTSDSFDISGLLYPEAANSSFLGQVEVGPYFYRQIGKDTARYDITVFGNFATRKNDVTVAGADHDFTASASTFGVKAAWSFYPTQNTFRIIVGTGYNRFFISNADLADARLALGRPNLPRTLSGIRSVVAAQVNALVIEAQFPDLRSKHGVEEKDLTDFQSIVRIYVMGKFLSFGAF